MKYIKTKFADAYLIQAERIEDNRGYFATTFSEQDFAAHSLKSVSKQSNTSFNHKTGTVRGMHFQAAPYAETKLVRCTAGAIFDVIVDLRKGSSTYGQWEGFELSSENLLMFYIPEGFAHGYQTLTDKAEVFYQLSQLYNAQSAGGIRYNDPEIGIKWPLTATTISERDMALPLLSEWGGCEW